MCMITYLPPNVAVPMSGIANGGSWNDDGHGWAVAAGTGYMVTGKSMVLEQALEGFKEARDAFPEAPALFHSRWATHGVTDVTNVHPFNVAGKAHAGNVVVAHNGVLPAAFHPTKKDRRSDTRVMADSWLGKQSDGRWTKNERRTIGNLIGLSNKLAILSVSPLLDKPRGFLVNGSQGEWVKGAWFSNGDHSWSRGWDRHYGGWKGTTTLSSGVTVIKGGSVTGGSMFGVKDECPVCGANDKYFDWKAGVCTFCDTCLDCAESLQDCLCFYGSKDRESDNDGMSGICLKCGMSALGDCDCEDESRIAAILDSEQHNRDVATIASKAVERYLGSGEGRHEWSGGAS